ncbi:hypothetical protein F3J37_01070 [Pantoea sp. Al-1710]|uniref:Uncharacterized protein n=1 Tax=Candidatus Pantoea communis TaxID=2608354 RepID=A0ABX0RKG3_9GAMM|nr:MULTISPECIES: hypothetical protein [Pantoea]NIG13032.1 hypothetical protein [Pantoea sp. Cy-640]NIG17267.1 hypothetical protein [Pantoea communis]
MSDKKILTIDGKVNFENAIAAIQNPLLKNVLKEREELLKNKMWFGLLYLTMFYENYYYHLYNTEFVNIRDASKMAGVELPDTPTKEVAFSRAEYYTDAFHFEMKFFIDANEKIFMQRIVNDVAEYLAHKNPESTHFVEFNRDPNILRSILK